MIYAILYIIFIIIAIFGIWSIHRKIDKNKAYKLLEFHMSKNNVDAVQALIVTYGFLLSKKTLKDVKVWLLEKYNEL